MKRYRIRPEGWGTATLFSVLLILVAAPVWAQDHDTHGLPLWELTHRDNTVYLMGSIHLLRPEVYPLDDALYEAFDAAEVVAFELDFDEMMAAAPIMVARGTLDDGRTLRDVVPDDLYAEVEERAGAMGLPIEAVERMKPWMAALTFSMMQIQLAGFEAASGIDLHFHERAKEAGKTIIGLETMEQQLDAFDGLDEEGQAEFLRSTLDELDETAAQLDEATELWRRGDSEGLAEMFIESMGDQPELLDRLLYARNREWIPEIEALLEGPATAIVIVGMGHLVGTGSVIELLEERGHDVRPVRRAPAGVGVP